MVCYQIYRHGLTFSAEDQTDEKVECTGFGEELQTPCVNINSNKDCKLLTRIMFRAAQTAVKTPRLIALIIRVVTIEFVLWSQE